MVYKQININEESHYKIKIISAMRNKSIKEIIEEIISEEYIKEIQVDKVL